MVEKLTEHFDAEDYFSSGGRWDEKTFNELMEILARREEDPIPVRETFLLQAEGMGKSSGIEITPEEIYLYGVLRERPVTIRLSDREVMAEVILLRGNIAKRKLFESKYPPVNFNPEIQGFESEQEGVRQITYGIDNNQTP